VRCATLQAIRMSPWFGKAVILAGSIAMVLIRAPHGQRSRGVKVARSDRGALETALLAFAMLAFFVPLVWVATPLFAFAEYPLHPLPLLVGVACLVVGLWIFARSHADLGTNWSITLEVREQHQLVTQGIYRTLRHPMYSALLLYSLGQALVVPNWIAGPSYGVAMALLISLRLGPEERMMRERFGDDYEAYRRRTRRLIPGVW
jgi:protein-S-isoprenylcysteine O-methyltransferase Ste14